MCSAIRTTLSQWYIAAPAPEHTMAQGMTTAQAQPAGVAAPINGGDAAAGRLVFRKCQACHSMEPGKTILGPSLAGILGRKAGSDPSYSYSPAMKQANNGQVMPGMGH